MSRTQLETLTKRALEDLPAPGQGVALHRAQLPQVVAWSTLTRDQLARLYAACRTVSLILNA